MPRPAPSLEGQRFGNLVVLGRAKVEDKKNAYWLCKCDCCNTVKATSTQLRSGKRVSCGCKNKTTAIDITGKRFGKLVAVERGPNTKYGKTTWRCLCDCGNEIVVVTSNLGRTANSCGCTRKEKSRVDCIDGTRVRNLVQRKPRMKLIKDSGVKGVTWAKANEKWVAKITFKGKKYYLGYYDDVFKATQARKRAEEKLYKPVFEKYYENC